MTTLQFVLSPEAITRMYDSLQCLLKFGETVGLEASREKVGEYQRVVSFLF